MSLDRRESDQLFAGKAVSESNRETHNCGGWCEVDDDLHKEWHDKQHPNATKAHWCLDYDGLWICEMCEEFETCWCYAEATK